MADSPTPHAQRLHDLRATYASFKTVMELLRAGYRFDDADAPAALAQLTKSLTQLETEIRRLEADWQA